MFDYITELLNKNYEVDIAVETLSAFETEEECTKKTVLAMNTKSLLSAML